MIKKIIKLISEKNIISQREIAGYLDISLGSVNKKLNKIIDLNLVSRERISYRESKYNLTEKGKKYLLEHREYFTAVILLAGEVKKIDKTVGEIEVGDKTLVERHIEQLLEKGIKNIIIVVGKNISYYLELKEKYSNIEIIENKKYKTTGNMYSLYLARNLIQSNIILLDGDIIYEKLLLDELISSNHENLTIVDKNIEDTEDCLFVDCRDGKLLNLSKDRFSIQNISGQLIGISKITYKNYLKMIENFTKINNSMYFYEYFFFDKEVFHEMNTLEKESVIWAEVDNLKQYKHLLKNILPKLREE